MLTYLQSNMNFPISFIFHLCIVFTYSLPWHTQASLIYPSIFISPSTNLHLHSLNIWKNNKINKKRRKLQLNMYVCGAERESGKTCFFHRPCTLLFAFPPYQYSRSLHHTHQRSNISRKRNTKHSENASVFSFINKRANVRL